MKIDDDNTKKVFSFSYFLNTNNNQDVGTEFFLIYLKKSGKIKYLFKLLGDNFVKNIKQNDIQFVLASEIYCENIYKTLDNTLWPFFCSSDEKRLDKMNAKTISIGHEIITQLKTLDTLGGLYLINWQDLKESLGTIYYMIKKSVEELMKNKLNSSEKQFYFYSNANVEDIFLHNVNYNEPQNIFFVFNK